MLLHRILPLIAKDLSAALPIAREIEKLGYRVHITEKSSMFTPQQQVDPAEETYDLITVSLGFVEAVITVLAITPLQLYASIGVFQHYPTEHDKVEIDALFELSSMHAKLPDIINILRALQPLANKQAAVMNKLNELQDKFNWTAHTSHYKQFPRTPALGAADQVVPLHAELDKLGFSFSKHRRSSNNAGETYFYDKKQATLADFTQLAKANGFRLVQQDNHWWSFTNSAGVSLNTVQHNGIISGVVVVVPDNPPANKKPRQTVPPTKKSTPPRTRRQTAPPVPTKPKSIVTPDKHQHLPEDAEAPRNKPTKANVAISQTILQQLGGNKFIAMTGAKHLVYLHSGLQFDLSGRSTQHGINRITIILTPDDSYTITAYRLRNLDLKKLTHKTGVLAGQLAAVFTAITGLDTHL